jgi:hypothetical protein
MPKRVAIQESKPQLLTLLLEEDETIDASLVEIACENRQRDMVSILIEHGWPINEPLGSFGIPPLWSVEGNFTSVWA